MAAYSPFLSCGVGGRAASLYALLTGFRASDHPSMRFAAARPSMGRTVRLAVVFVGGGMFRCGRWRVFGARDVVLGRFVRASTVNVRY